MARYWKRREFLKSSALASAGFWMAGRHAMAQSRSPNEKLNIGIIGVHSRGAANMAAVASENIVALCDVDENYLAEAAKKYPKAKTYIDWRKMLDQKDIDAVVVSTTEHTHAPGQRHGHEAGQARVLREAAGPLGVRSARDARNLPSR